MTLGCGGNDAIDLSIGEGQRLRDETQHSLRGIDGVKVFGDDRFGHITGRLQIVATEDRDGVTGEGTAFEPAGDLTDRRLRWSGGGRSEERRVGKESRARRAEQRGRKNEQGAVTEVQGR